jgi:hypothetical protein
MFFTANVMVLSAAKAADEAKTLTVITTQARSLLIGILHSRVEEWRRYAEPRFSDARLLSWGLLRSQVEQQRSEEVEADRREDEHRRHNEPELDEPIRQGPRTRFTTGARTF